MAVDNERRVVVSDELYVVDVAGKGEREIIMLIPRRVSCHVGASPTTTDHISICILAQHPPRFRRKKMPIHVPEEITDISSYTVLEERRKKKELHEEEMLS